LSGISPSTAKQLDPPVQEQPLDAHGNYTAAHREWQQTIADRLSAVGNKLDAAGASVALTAGAVATITTLSLPPGEWDLQGTATFQPAAGTTPFFLAIGVSTVAGSLGSTLYNVSIIAGFSGGTQLAGYQRGAFQTVAGGPVSLSLNATTTVYLSAQSNFSGGTMAVDGTLSARQTR
jgi:hypothetical protein